MFIFGKRKTNGCNVDDGCNCMCEEGADSNGTCAMKYGPMYDLYRYTTSNEDQDQGSGSGFWDVKDTDELFRSC